MDITDYVSVIGNCSCEPIGYVVTALVLFVMDHTLLLIPQQYLATTTITQGQSITTMSRKVWQV